LWQNGFMTTKARRAPRRTEALSREVIVQAATEILDAGGEDALTLRALTVRLATGYGAIYHHVADRDDLLAAATDHIIARIVTDLAADAKPRPALRSVAAGLFDAIVAHPWAGAQLNRDPLRPALLDIYEIISRQLQALDVPQRALPDSAGVLVSYILGVAGQNAANARALASSKMDRSAFLAAVAARWAQLDPARYPSVHQAGTNLLEHDDRVQFLAGIDLILAGIETLKRAARDQLCPLRRRFTGSCLPRPARRRRSAACPPFSAPRPLTNKQHARRWAH
jgi:AcrR family transcriptional regulator